MTLLSLCKLRGNAGPRRSAGAESGADPHRIAGEQTVSAIWEHAASRSFRLLEVSLAALFGAFRISSNALSSRSTMVVWRSRRLSHWAGPRPQGCHSAEERTGPRQDKGHVDNGRWSTMQGVSAPRVRNAVARISLWESVPPQQAPEMCASDSRVSVDRLDCSREYQHRG